MAKTIKQRFIDYMNEPAKKMSDGDFMIWSFIINTCMWTIFGYISVMAMCAVIILPIQIVVGGFRWIFG